MASGLELAEANRQARDRARTAECMREHRASWQVVAYRCNHSAFNGGHWTPSAYSAVRCGNCGRYWRTRAAYVDTLPRGDARR